MIFNVFMHERINIITHSTKNVKNIFVESNFDSQCQWKLLAIKLCSVYDLGSSLDICGRGKHSDGSLF